jgi:hypothetical protein
MKSIFKFYKNFKLIDLKIIRSLLRKESVISINKNNRVDPIIESLVLRAKTRQQVAVEYGVNVKTLKARLKEMNIYLPPGLIFPETLKIIYYALGLPPGLKNG